jgi:peptide chain release factor
MGAAVSLHVSSGRGPAECGWVVRQVVSQLQKEAADGGLRLRVTAAEKGAEPGTWLSASVEISGPGAEAMSRRWLGTVQWIGASPFRPRHPRKNWFVGVTVAPATPSLDLDLASVRLEAFRAGGPGGQHRNKVATAVRATHLRTGIVVEASEERSQQLNRSAALGRLAARLQALQDHALNHAANLRWRQHDEVVRGKPIKVFRGPDFEEVVP